MIQDAEGKPVLYQFSSVVILGKPSVNPTPQPPIFTPSEFNLETQVKQWLTTVNRTSIGNKGAIANALKESAEAAKQGKFETLAEMETALGVVLSKVIENKAAWAGFGASLQSAISVLKSPSVDKIKTPQDLGRALTEVVKGMVP